MPSAPLVSVSGVRGVVSESFTPDIVQAWVSAFAVWIRNFSQHSAPPTIVIGRDPRPSGAWALNVAAEEFEKAGVRPIIVGIVPTPTAQLAVTHHRAAGGLVITGSHNPQEWNALKFLGLDGVFLSAEDIERLKQYVIASNAKQSPGTEEIASESVAPRNDDAAIDRHIENVLALPIDVGAIRARKFRVVLDPVNGAGALAVPLLLERLGCSVSVINGEPNGLFAHPPEPTPANLVGLCARVRAEHADLGLAVDPDADRLALVDEQGTALNEEYTITLACLAVLEEQRGSVVAVNLSTTRMVEDVAARFGGLVVRTSVGERHVVEGMRAHRAVIGGEGNGGVIFPASHEGRDSLVGVALVLDLLARSQTNLPGSPAPTWKVGLPTLSRLVATLPRYVMRKEKFPLVEAWDHDRAASLLHRAFPGAQFSTLDGVRVDTADGWLHLRPSNTEPIVRLIGEANNEKALERIFRTVQEAAVSPVPNV